MARYIDVEKVELKGLALFDENLDVLVPLSVVRKALQMTPTADVAPRAEVDRLQEEADRYKRYFFRHDYDEMIAEVLDRLDRFINANCIEIKDERGIKGYVTSGVHFAIADFKKKYTGGK